MVSGETRPLLLLLHCTAVLCCTGCTVLYCALPPAPARLCCGLGQCSEAGRGSNITRRQHQLDHDRYTVNTADTKVPQL